MSHQVSRLEDLLGTVLFLRTSQGLVPTDEGKLLFPVLGRGFDAMARVLDQLGGRRDIEVLNIGVNTTFALGWLMPRIALFRKEHPEIDLRISTNNNRVEILREGLDMAIRFGNGGWTGHEAIPLVEAPLAPLCAPALTARLPHPSDLAQVTLLRSYRSAEWTQWFDAAGTDCPPRTGPVFDSSVALAELAASGGHLRHMRDGLGDQRGRIALRRKPRAQIPRLDIAIPGAVDPIAKVIIPQPILKQTHDAFLGFAFDLTNFAH